MRPGAMGWRGTGRAAEEALSRENQPVERKLLPFFPPEQSSALTWGIPRGSAAAKLGAQQD